MHWVKATAPDGRPCYLNMSAIMSMIRVDSLTICYIGGLCQVAREDGSTTIVHANSQVIETPAELLNLPAIEPGNAEADSVWPPPPAPSLATAPPTKRRKVRA